MIQIVLLAAVVIALVAGVLQRRSGDRVTYVLGAIFRLVYSLTFGVPFFVMGFLVFLFLDIFFPESSKSYVFLTNFFKWGSCYWFKGVKLETDDFEVHVQKQRKLNGD